jgi:hypothetical protein
MRGGRRRSRRARGHLCAAGPAAGDAAQAGDAGRRIHRAARSFCARGSAAAVGASPDPDRRAELDKGLAQRRHRQGDADGEHRAGRRQARPEQSVPPVPRLGPRVARPRTVRGRTVRRRTATHGVPAPDPFGQETGRRGRPGMLAGVRRPGPDPRADPLQPVRARLDLVRGGMQGMTQEVAEVHGVVSWRRAIGAGSGHDSCSRAARRAVMPRDV